ncbi:hypothetical protein DMENIID0001_119310 [Sergentomyia squamirostris]
MGDTVQNDEETVEQLDELMDGDCDNLSVGFGEESHNEDEAFWLQWQISPAGILRLKEFGITPAHLFCLDGEAITKIFGQAEFLGDNLMLKRQLSVWKLEQKLEETEALDGKALTYAYSVHKTLEGLLNSSIREKLSPIFAANVKDKSCRTLLKDMNKDTTTADGNDCILILLINAILLPERQEGRKTPRSKMHKILW